MKYVVLWLILSAVSIANPIIVYEGMRETQMTNEDVVLRVGPTKTEVSGDYTFVQLAAKPSKKEDDFILIWLPVYAQKDAEPNLLEMKPTYAPKITIRGITYEPSDVRYGRHPWESFWRGAKFVLVAFQFEIPRNELPDRIQLHVSYTQPHMIARGISYACYCPFRPTVQNPLYRTFDDRQFTLRALASDGVKLQRVSQNTKVVRDDPTEITLHCIHKEHVIVSIKKA